MADCEQICDTMGISDVDLNFGVIPISHSYGFSKFAHAADRARYPDGFEPRSFAARRAG